MSSQKHDLVRSLRQRRTKGLSQYEATVLLGIMRLSERIRELERLGYIIKRRTETKQGRHNVVRYTRYRLVCWPEHKRYG